MIPLSEKYKQAEQLNANKMQMHQVELGSKLSREDSLHEINLKKAIAELEQMYEMQKRKGESHSKQESRLDEMHKNQQARMDDVHQLDLHKRSSDAQLGQKLKFEEARNKARVMGGDIPVMSHEEIPRPAPFQQSRGVGIPAETQSPMEPPRPNNVVELPRGPGPIEAGSGPGDIVPAMLEPGEAVIPRHVAQDPRWKPIIDQMVNGNGQTHADGEPPMVESPQGFQFGSTGVEDDETKRLLGLSPAPVGSVDQVTSEQNQQKIVNWQKEAVQKQNELNTERAATTVETDNLVNRYPPPPVQPTAGAIALDPSRRPLMNMNPQVDPTEMPRLINRGEPPRVVTAPIASDPTKMTVVTPETPAQVAPDGTLLTVPGIRNESGGNPHAVNPSTRATGIYQHMPATYAGLQKIAQTKVANGTATDNDKLVASTPFDQLKGNAEVQHAAQKLLVIDNKNVLKNMGVDPSDYNATIAHGLGAPNAAKLLKLDPNMSIAEAVKVVPGLGQQLAANKTWQGGTVGEVIGKMAQHFGVSRSTDTSGRIAPGTEVITGEGFTVGEPPRPETAEEIQARLARTGIGAGDPGSTLSQEDKNQLEQTGNVNQIDPERKAAIAEAKRQKAEAAAAAADNDPKVKGAKDEGSLKDAFMNLFTMQGFKDMLGFNNNELLRMAVMAAGSRMMGYNNRQSIGAAFKKVSEQSERRRTLESQEKRADDRLKFQEKKASDRHIWSLESEERKEASRQASEIRKAALQRQGATESALVSTTMKYVLENGGTPQDAKIILSQTLGQPIPEGAKLSEGFASPKFGERKINAITVEGLKGAGGPISYDTRTVTHRNGNKSTAVMLEDGKFIDYEDFIKDVKKGGGTVREFDKSTDTDTGSAKLIYEHSKAASSGYQKVIDSVKVKDPSGLNKGGVPALKLTGEEVSMQSGAYGRAYGVDVSRAETRSSWEALVQHALRDAISDARSGIEVKDITPYLKKANISIPTGIATDSDYFKLKSADNKPMSTAKIVGFSDTVTRAAEEIIVAKGGKVSTMEINNTGKQMITAIKADWDGMKKKPFEDSKEESGFVRYAKAELEKKLKASKNKP